MDAAWRLIRRVLIVSDLLEVVVGREFPDHSIVERRSVVHDLVSDFYASSKLEIDSRVALAIWTVSFS